MRFLVIDDSETITQFVGSLLQEEGHEVESCASNVDILKIAQSLRPDCVLLDLVMPGMDGFEICKKLRETPELANTKIIVLSAKSYEFDKRRAMQLGADGYIVKPIKAETFIPEINKVIKKEFVLAYWGTRGTLPVPGKDSLRYGGNTSCVTIQIDGEPLFIFDAGTGIKKLSNHLMSLGVKRLTAKIFISHPHWDHINALPFFAPLYIPGNEIEILGASQGDTTIRNIISAQMDNIYFPVTIREFGARVFFRDLRGGSLTIGKTTIDMHLLNHPGNCLGYRINHNQKSVCYITDNELFPKDLGYFDSEFEEKLIQFIQGTDILIIDCTYLDSDYPSKIGWGHSCVSEVVQLAEKAKVKALHLFHHDPDQDDDAIDRKMAQAREKLAQLGSHIKCLCAAEEKQFVV